MSVLKRSGLILTSSLRRTQLDQSEPSILASSVLYYDTDTLLALRLKESGASSVLEHFADAFTGAGRALEVRAGTNFLRDGLTLTEA